MNSGKITFPVSSYSEPFSVTNKGLRVQFSGQTDPSSPVELVVTFESIVEVEHLFLYYSSQPGINIRLRKLTSDDSRYSRVDSHELVALMMDRQYNSSVDVRQLFMRDPQFSPNHKSA